MSTLHIDRDLLRELPLLADLPDGARARLMRAATMRSLAAREVLLSPGEAGRDVYVVLVGALEVIDPDGGVVARIGSGGIVGERALLNGGKRNATVRAARDSRIARLPEPTVRRLLEDHPAVLRRLAETLADRTSASTERPVACTRIALTAATTAPVRAVADRLAASLGEVGPVAVVDAARIDAEVGPLASRAPLGHHHATAVSAWLARLEEAHRFVVLVGDGHRRWDSTCRRQADTNVVLATEARARDERVPEGARVVILRRGGDPVPGLAASWHDAVPATAVSHLDLIDDRDVARLARALTGRSLGLVLGGGGARGLAHIGVLRALDDLGIAVDSVGGTSIGALAAALCALGHDADLREAKAIAGLVGTKRLIGWTLPLLSVSSAKRVTAMLQSEELFGDRCIEDLPLPYFAMSAAFPDGAAVVHDRGPLWLAARASISLPGVLPPVCIDGDLLVDGAMVNNVPVDVMRQRLEGRVLAVNLRGRAPTPQAFDFDPSISGWRVLASRLPGRSAIRMPNPAATMLRAKDLAGKQAHLERLAMADLVLEPPVDDVSNLNFKAGLPLVARAYDHARPALESWLASEEAGVVRAAAC